MQHRTPAIRALGRFSLLVALFGTAGLFAQAEEERIQRVENGLLPRFLITGEKENTMRLQERMAAYGVPGLSLAVIHEGRIDWVRAYGVADSGSRLPITPNTLFQAASISKPVAAAALLILVQEGRLKLDEDVNRVLRSWKVPENRLTRREKVTLRRILTHSAGLTVHGFPGYPLGARLPTLLQILDGLQPANTPPIRVDLSPGSQYRYSGGGYTVLQQLLEEVNGTSFSEWVRQVLLAPFGMHDSTFQQPLPAELSNRAASGHDSFGNLLPGRWHAYPESAAAGLWTTATDLARFAVELQSAFNGGSRGPLSSPTVREMLSPQGNGLGGLGFPLNGDRETLSFAHGGSNAGFRCRLFAYAGLGMGAVIMANSDSAEPLIQEVLRSLAVEYGWPDFQPEVRNRIQVPDALLQRLEGYYRLRPGVRIRILREKNRLYWQLEPDGPLFELVPESETAFFSKSDGLRFSFDVDEGGRVIGLDLGLRVLPRVEP